MSSEASNGAPHRTLNTYVVGIVLLAILLTAFDVTHAPTDFPDRAPVLLFVLLGITAVAEHVSFQVHRGWATAAATLPHVAIALLLQPGHAEVVGLLGAAGYGLSRRFAFPKLVFNAAVVALAVGAAGHVALALGGPRLIEGTDGWLGPLVATLASVVYYLVSVATVSMAVALDQRTPPWPIARDKLGFLALADLGLELTGAVLAVVLTTAPTWAPALLLPAVLVYLVKRAHERVATSEARLEAIVGSAMDAIITIDDERRIVLFNRAAEAMFGYARSRVLSEPVAMLGVADAPPEDRDAAGAGSRPPNVVARRASGEIFPVEMTRADLQVRGKRLSTLIVRDISARRRADDERMRLLDSERAARVAAERAIGLRDEFLLVAAHELRTPITSLRGYAQLVARRLEARDAIEPAVLQRALDVVDQQSGKLTRLISLLLDFAALQAGLLELRFEPADLAPLVRQSVVSAQSGAPQHTIDVQSPDSLILSIDPRRLQQVLDNLLSNAIRFSPWGGAIEVGLTRSGTDWACLEVRDHGLGVAPEHRRHLFDGFYRAHADSHTSGLGLGLHVTRHIVERHGGTIEFVAPPSGGTHFVVRLPLAPPVDQSQSIGPLAA